MIMGTFYTEDELKKVLKDLNELKQMITVENLTVGSLTLIHRKITQCENKVNGIILNIKKPN